MILAGDVGGGAMGKRMTERAGNGPKAEEGSEEVGGGEGGNREEETGDGEMVEWQTGGWHDREGAIWKWGQMGRGSNGEGEQ